MCSKCVVLGSDVWGECVLLVSDVCSKCVMLASDVCSKCWQVMCAMSVVLVSDVSGVG